MGFLSFLVCLFFFRCFPAAAYAGIGHTIEKERACRKKQERKVIVGERTEDRNKK